LEKIQDLDLCSSIRSCGGFIGIGELQEADAQIVIWAYPISRAGLAQALQERCRPSLPRLLLISLLQPEPKSEQKLRLVQVKHHPCEMIVEVSPRLTQYCIAFVHHFLTSYYALLFEKLML